MTLDELTPWLFARVTGGIRWGLERTEELLAGVDDPHRRFQSILIGGTNGKGSVAALCDSALRVEGRVRVGLYTSPHLVSLTERVQVDGIPISDERMAEAADRLRPAIERTGASFFEATTAMAFLLFAEAGVDIAVVEVGLGGRLDSTNVLDPLVTGVTNVGLDHTDYLGPTLAEIATEKAGIFKRGVPALGGVSAPDLAVLLRSAAARVGAPYLDLDWLAEYEVLSTGLGGTRLALHSRRWGDVELRLPLPGVHQARNAVFAAELLGLLPKDVRPGWESISAGFDRVSWPGRLQVERIRGTTWLLDVAHNADGAEVLAGAMQVLDLPRPVVLVAGILSDKDWRVMLRPLVQEVDAVILTTADSAPAGRRWDLEEVGRWSSQELGLSPRLIPKFSDALARATTLAPHGTAVVTGSVHTVGDAMKELGIGGRIV